MLDPRPPRQIDDNIPKELERICLKALSKRATERYTTAKDLADDLRHFLAEHQMTLGAAARPATPTRPESSGGTTGQGHSATTDTDSQPLRIVPKGLRSYDEHDADFFLELLPGPRDREGLPESIRFWKTRIEETDGGQTFPVGLIYGPSGCGKSSLVKAGLLPSLADHVVPIYVEATANETEPRLLNGIRRCCPALDESLNLKDAVAALRCGHGIAAGQKVLIVLDQFEQRLHAKGEQEHGEFIQALRQCDGGVVQCVVLMRDDFWMAVTRFFQELEIRLVEGQNSAAVDLFDTDHAGRVLAAFGRAFGRLPENAGQTSWEQKQFLKRSVKDLAAEGKVICVRLALFAEMMKQKPWTRGSLKNVGGTSGIGVTFLEETFSASTAPPAHRLHQTAARAVLNMLLPESGTQIKGHVRSYEELLQASGYAARPHNFDDLIRILDSEIRLITPTDPEGRDEGRSMKDERATQTSDSSRILPPFSLRHYQLTHDYLVPSLRAWLTRKQEETRRGRAELRLADRSALWNAKPENRHLPSWWEWVSIRSLAGTKRWTEPQRKMMQRAGRVHGARFMILAILVAVLVFAGLHIRGRVIEASNEQRAVGLVTALLKADIEQVPDLITSLSNIRHWANPKLQTEYRKHGEDSRERLHVSLALLPTDAQQVDYLKGRLLTAHPTELDVIRRLLAGHQTRLTEDLWQVVENLSGDEEQHVLHAAGGLALYDPASERWQAVAERIVDALVNENPLRVSIWMNTLQPIRGHLIGSLGAVFRNPDGKYTDTQRDLATNVLEEYAADDVETLSELVLDAEPQQFVALFDELAGHGQSAIERLNNELGRKPRADWQDEPLDVSWPQPDASLVGQFKAAQGLIAERFAFCQTMLLEHFVELAGSLRQSGYRPIRLRPYAHADAVLVAAVWARDGRDWKLLHGLSAEEMIQQDEQLRGDGFAAVDVAGYVATGAETASERYAGLWARRTTSEHDFRIHVGVSALELQNFSYGMNKAYWLPAAYTLQSFLGLNGQHKICGVRWNGTSEADYRFSGNQRPSTFGNNDFPDMIIWDIDVSNAEKKTKSTDQRWWQLLAEAEARLAAKPDDLDAREAQASAHYYLGNDEKAIECFNILIEEAPALSPIRPVVHQYRAILHARMGNADEAKKDLAAFKEWNPPASIKACLDALVAEYLGEDTEGMKRLDALLNEHAENTEWLYDGACAYSLASSVFGERDAAKSKAYAQRAVKLLHQAVSNGFDNYSYMEEDSNLDPIRDHAGFRQIMAAGSQNHRYASVWQTSSQYESQGTHDLSPEENLQRCRDLISQGYRPAAISAASIGQDNRLVTASVWHKPLVPEPDKEQLAQRQANAAVGLLRMGHGETFWPLLRHSRDPRLRSWITHRLSPGGAHPKTIVQQLKLESDISIRRALILSLGEYEYVSVADGSLTGALLAMYRDDPDPGIHGASEWLLRRWGKQEELEQIDKELATGTREGERSWYVNRQGQTMVVLPGPVEFLMGSPSTEAGRGSSERLHRKRIGRSFAIATKEVTVRQFQRFLQEIWGVGSSYTDRYSLDSDGPQTSLTWYEAAAYCRWLSEQEDMPEEQMCYPAIPEIKAGMRLPRDYLTRTGYRLPTEAEWEYACRAGALTSRHYGHSEQLLGHYGWHLDTASNRAWPVASLKPNDHGLFDMYGNAAEWCQEIGEEYTWGTKDQPSEDREDRTILSDSGRRALRGGAFSYHPWMVRSANRIHNQPSVSVIYVGFRPARTYP